MNEQNDNRYWFKRRRYGYGWIPVAWQGWLTVFIFLTIVIGVGVIFEKQSAQNDPTSSASLMYLGIIGFAVIALIIISWLKGPQPRWRWGKQPADDPIKDF